MLWDKANEGRQAEYPDTIIVRFVARNFYDAPDRSKIHFLDIGSGRHAPHTKYLRKEGFTVTSIDFSKNATADIRADIRDDGLFGDESFDCVLDFRTLCHVENPPIKKIYAWLKPGGTFFSVWPGFGTQADLANKGFCRPITGQEIHEMLLPMFDPIGIRLGYEEYQDPNSIRRHKSWQIMAHK